MNTQDISESLILSIRAYSSGRGYLSARRVVDVLACEIRFADNEYELCVLKKMRRKWNYIVDIHRVETPPQSVSKRPPGKLIDISVGGSKPLGFINTHDTRNSKNGYWIYWECMWLQPQHHSL